MAKASSSVAPAAAPVLAGKRMDNGAVAIASVERASRLALRIAPENCGKLTRKLGLKLPIQPGQSTSKAGRTAMWIGPDEWLVIDFDRTDTSILPKPEDTLYSAVDVSHRNTGISISGPGAENTLAAGCPRDFSLDTFPVGACTRTVFGKAEVVIWRQGEHDFHLECWRSFAPYVWAYLLDAARDAHV